MTRFKTVISMASAAALLSGSAAIADVTAAQVWEDWKKNFEIYGEDAITIGGESTLGGTITISDIAIDFSDQTTNINVAVGDITFAEQGDGTVSITMEQSMPITIGATDTAGAMTMDVTNTGLSIIASGAPGAMTYDAKADQYAMRIDEITEDDGSVVAGQIYVAGNNFAGQYTTSGTDMREIAYNVALGSMDLLVDVTDPIDGGQFVMSGQLNDMTGAANVVMPAGMSMDDPDTMFADGFDVSGGYAFGGANYLFDVDADGSKASGTVSMGSGSIDLDLGADKIGYGGAVTDVAMAIQSMDFPFPISISLAEYGFGLQIPMQKTEEPADFGFSINLTELAVNDEIWMLGDPMGALPHDPATLRLDLGGTVKLFNDLMDPSQAQSMAMGGTPGEIHSVTLNELTLDIAGALLTGMGGFTFDNSDLSTIPGIPRPNGEITVNLKGANKLVDSLVSMGLVPEDQAMMGRMMMGMFARVVGDDELSSTISVNDKGHVLANGQRIQ